MSKYHGDQYWTDIHHQTIRDWREMNDDDFDTLRAMRHEREVRQRDQRARARRYRQYEARDMEV
ncbi:MAG TPA: hypothetical protein VF132_14280 [Rudaea sp.]